MPNPNFTCVLDAWRDGKTLYGRMHYYRSGSYLYTDYSFPTPTMNLGGTVYYDNDFANRVHNGIYVGDVYSTTFSRTVAGTGDRTVTWTAGSGGRSDFEGTWSKTVNFPVEYTAPTGLAISVVEVYPDGGKFNVSISSYGNPSSTSGRYIEAAILNQNSYGNTYKYQIAYNTSSSSITVSNKNYRGGSLSIQANTQYYYGCYADNTQLHTSKIQGQFVTLAHPPAMSVVETGTDYAIIKYELRADGGYYAKNIQYSMDNGSTWTTSATINTGSATSGTFRLENLMQDNSYHLKTRVSTASGETTGNDLPFTTFQTIKFYGSVNEETTQTNKLYFSRNKRTKLVDKLYGPMPLVKLEKVTGTINPESVGNVTAFDPNPLISVVNTNLSERIDLTENLLTFNDLELLVLYSEDDGNGGLMWEAYLLFLSTDPNDEDGWWWYLSGSDGSYSLAELGLTANITQEGIDIINLNPTNGYDYFSKLIYLKPLK